MKSSRSHFFDQVYVFYIVFSPKKDQPGPNNEQKLRQIQNVEHSTEATGGLKSSKNIRFNVIESNTMSHFYYFRIKWARDITKYTV